MISPAYCQVMTAYNAEMNRRLYAAASRLSDAERKLPRGVFFGSIHGTLNHLIWGDSMWMLRFAGWDNPGLSIRESAGVFDDFSTLTAARVALDARLEAWAAGITEADLRGELTWFSGALQKDVTRPRRLLLVHMFNHQTHHRGQVHAMLTACGQDTGDTDLPFIVSLDDQPGRAGA